VVPALDVLSVSVLRLLKLRKVVMEETMRKKSKSKKGFYQDKNSPGDELD